VNYFNCAIYNNTYWFLFYTLLVVHARNDGDDSLCSLWIVRRWLMFVVLMKYWAICRSSGALVSSRRHRHARWMIWSAQDSAIRSTSPSKSVCRLTRTVNREHRRLCTTTTWSALQTAILSLILYSAVSILYYPWPVMCWGKTHSPQTFTDAARLAEVKFCASERKSWYLSCSRYFS